MALGIGITLRINVDFENVKNETYRAFDLALIDTGRKILGDAYDNARSLTVQRGGKTYVAWDTGNLAGRTGIAHSGFGESFYGPLYLMNGEIEGSQGLPGASVNSPQIAIASAAGYGRWVHEGTSKVPARPYALNAVLSNVSTFQQELQKRLAQLRFPVGANP